MAVSWVGGRRLARKPLFGGDTKRYDLLLHSEEFPMLRLFVLLAGIGLGIAAHAASASFNSANGELTISEIGIAGQPDRYRDVVLRLAGPSPVRFNVASATSLDRKSVV